MNSPELLVIILTTSCNLSCRYCYLDCSSSGETMAEEMLYTALSGLKEAPREVIISGGEPTLVPESLEKALRLVRKRFPRVRLSLQSNGTLFDSRLVQILRKYRVGLGLSLDGPPEVNESLRGESRAVVSSLKLLSREAYPCGITITLTDKSVSFLPETVLFLAQFEAVRSLGLDLLRLAGRATREELPRPEALKKGLKGLKQALAWLKARGRSLSLREKRPRTSRSYCPAARGRSLVLTPSGEIYPCASLVGRREYLLGEAGKGLSPRRLTSSCEGCPREEDCPGRCPSRFILSPQGGALECLLRGELVSGLDAPKRYFKETVHAGQSVISL